MTPLRAQSSLSHCRGWPTNYLDAQRNLGPPPRASLDAELCSGCRSGEPLAGPATWGCAGSLNAIWQAAGDFLPNWGPWALGLASLGQGVLDGGI